MDRTDINIHSIININIILMVNEIQTALWNRGEDCYIRLSDNENL